MRYGAALAGAALALCALFFVSVAQEKLAVRMPEPIQGSLYIAFLRLDGRQMSWGLLPLLLAGAHLLLCRALTDLLLKQEVYDRFAGPAGKLPLPPCCWRPSRLQWARCLHMSGGCADGRWARRLRCCWSRGRRRPCAAGVFFPVSRRAAACMAWRICGCCS